ncbi:hypothetical protein MMC25_004156 [Agyrium rufum]|nr:hypothetical protein [Agyrium rufum]
MAFPDITLRDANSRSKSAETSVISEYLDYFNSIINKSNWTWSFGSTVEEAPPPRFRLEDVQASGFPALIKCMWESYEDPPQSLFHLFCPILGIGCGARARAIEESTKRMQAWHDAEPESYWQKVVDVESGKIVAGALWKIYKKNPFVKYNINGSGGSGIDENGGAAHGGEEGAYWWPKGSRRNYVNQALEQFEKPQMELAARPHLYLNIIFTHPSSRRQGAAALVLEWGIAKAKELNVEIWLDAWEHGVEVYRRYGFTVETEVEIKPETADPDEEWMLLEEELRPMKIWVMKWSPER